MRWPCVQSSELRTPRRPRPPSWRRRCPAGPPAGAWTLLGPCRSPVLSVVNLTCCPAARQRSGNLLACTPPVEVDHGR